MKNSAVQYEEISAQAVHFITVYLLLHIPIHKFITSILYYDYCYVQYNISIFSNSNIEIVP